MGIEGRFLNFVSMGRGAASTPVRAGVRQSNIFRPQGGNPGQNRGIDLFEICGLRDGEVCIR